MAETWKFINSGFRSPAYNMACDEALLKWQSDELIPPVIRFYGWEPATLSIGYFQKVAKEIDLEALNRHEVGFVRRPTGGRAVLHEHELTYSVIVPETYPNMPKSVTEAYRVISEGIKEGFIELGLQASFSTPRTKAERSQLKRPQSAVCFDAPSWYELVVEGRKVAGSAQTRQKGIILQHGAILLDLNEDKMFDLFKFSSDAVRERMQRNFKNKAVTINELLGRQVPMREAEEAFKKGFERGLNITLEPLELSEEQEKEIEEIALQRYANDEWNFFR